MWATKGRLQKSFQGGGRFSWRPSWIQGKAQERSLHSPPTIKARTPGSEGLQEKRTQCSLPSGTSFLQMQDCSGTTRFSYQAMTRGF